MWVGGQRRAPAAVPPGKTRYPLYRRLGGTQGRSGQIREISPPPGLDPRTVQGVAIRYTDWDIEAHIVVAIQGIKAKDRNKYLTNLQQYAIH